EGLDLKQMTAMLSVIAEEKGLDEEVVLKVIEDAIAAAWRRDNGEREMNVRAVLNTKNGTADVFVAKTVIEDDIAYNPATEIPLKEAGKGKNLGDIVEEKHEVKSFGRVAAQIAKQVVLQGLREAERNAVLNEFEDKIGTVVAGVVQRVESRGDVLIDLGKGSGVMPKNEQVEGEFYSIGSRIKVYIKGIDRDESRARLILSRGDAKFIDFLFRQEVPELDNGSVEIRGIVREAGRRTKIAVASTIPGVDAVGTFVGGRGIRVQSVMNEIGEREKIDIIGWSDNPSEFIREALSPAEILRVEIEGKSAKVYVAEEQQPIAIGRQGQNVRLASKLTGFEIDIVATKPETKKKKRSKDAEDTLFSAIEEVEESAEE
ncbi:transcription termination factor NusA, partial [bacterium]|nr:transcription termination factor NusA [bacterium]